MDEDCDTPTPACLARVFAMPVFFGVAEVFGELGLALTGASDRGDGFFELFAFVTARPPSFRTEMSSLGISALASVAILIKEP